MTSKADEDPMIQKSALLAWGALYLGPAAPTTPYAAPIYGDLSGLAPLLIHVGAAEALLDDSIRLAAVTGAAGTSVRLDIAPEMIHVWHFFFPMLGEGRAAIASAGAFIAQHFKPKA
jgi:acetyl esterase/lipase